MSPFFNWLDSSLTVGWSRRRIIIDETSWRATISACTCASRGVLFALDPMTEYEVGVMVIVVVLY
jgi:hypothetical protein